MMRRHSFRLIDTYTIITSVNESCRGVETHSLVILLCLSVSIKHIATEGGPVNRGPTAA